MATAPLRSPSSMRLAISAISAGDATLCAPSPVGRNVAGSWSTAIRTWIWPMLTP